MAKIIISVPDEYVHKFEDSVDIFTSIIRHAPNVYNKIYPRDVVRYTLDVCISDKDKES